MTQGKLEIRIEVAQKSAVGHLISSLCARIQQSTKEELVMDILSSICSIDPFIKREGQTKVLHIPTHRAFQSRDPFEFEFRVDDLVAHWQRYTIYKDTLSISYLRSEQWPFREYLLKDAPHEEGLPVLSVIAGAPVLATLKRLGLFEFAERILDAQSSAFPGLRS